MTSSRLGRLLVVAAFTWLCAACEVTPEKIELWKGTQNGPEKIAAAIVNLKLDPGIRAQAAVALVQIGRWPILDKAFTYETMTEAERAKVADAMLPILTTMLGDVTRPGSPQKSQVDAKDALVFIFPWVSAPQKEEVQKQLIGWIQGDFNSRYLAGESSIKKIAIVVGPPIYKAMADMVRGDLDVLEPLCKLLKEGKDATALRIASQKLAESLQKSGPESTEAVFKAATVIEGEPLQKQLLAMAANTELPAGVQRYALRAYALFPNPADIAQLFAIAENEKNDRFHREESYYAIASMKHVEDLPKLLPLLKSKDPFYRGVGFKVCLQVGGAPKLSEILAFASKQDVKWTWEDMNEFVIMRIAGQMPDHLAPLLDVLRKSLGDPSPFVRAVAVHVLALKGNAKDSDLLKPLASDRARVQGFSKPTVGEAAKEAIAALGKNP